MGMIVETEEGRGTTDYTDSTDEERSRKTTGQRVLRSFLFRPPFLLSLIGVIRVIRGSFFPPLASQSCSKGRGSPAICARAFIAARCSASFLVLPQAPAWVCR